MQQMLDDLKSIPGVLGAFGYRAREGILCNNLPRLFKAERLAEAARSLSRITAAGRRGLPELSEVLIRFDESLLLCRPLEAGLYLIVVCDPGVNQNLLALSLNLALEDFQPSAASPPVAAAVAAPTPAADPALLRQSGPLASALQEMARLLAKVMGPMAGMVFDEALAAWAAQETPSKAGLPRLTEALCGELDDPEKSARYRQLVDEQLAAAG